jgi:hypothetical protein
VLGRLVAHVWYSVASPLVDDTASPLVDDTASPLVDDTASPLVDEDPELGGSVVQVDVVSDTAVGDPTWATRGVVIVSPSDVDFMTSITYAVMILHARGALIPQSDSR